ncbi:MAG: hypothetical protein COA79_22090 [Planctomycetota bacterium]|nr:MAG: hypothetical protein COA79_22090 [Planctomycetota bacterium]
MKYSFATTDETNIYCNEIVACLIEYSQLDESEALSMLNRYWDDKEMFDEDDFRLHEDPYFWSMCMVHGPKVGKDNPEWAKDKRYWPPPQNFYDRWYLDK